MANKKGSFVVKGENGASATVGFPKDAGSGVIIEGGTYPWFDLEGIEIPDIFGANQPTLTAYMGGNVRELAYGVNDKLDIRFHVPHDWVLNHNCYVHIHWSHNGTAISGNVVFTMNYTYAKGHNQSNFSAEKSQTITYNTTDIATTPQYRHRIDEVQLSDNGGTGNYLDSTLIEVDGLILMNLTLTTLPTITGGASSEVFIHSVDIHYQSTGIGTKEKAPNFYN